MPATIITAPWAGADTLTVHKLLLWVTIQVTQTHPLGDHHGTDVFCDTQTLNLLVCREYKLWASAEMNRTDDEVAKVKSTAL